MLEVRQPGSHPVVPAPRPSCLAFHPSCPLPAPPWHLLSSVPLVPRQGSSFQRSCLPSSRWLLPTSDRLRWVGAHRLAGTVAPEVDMHPAAPFAAAAASALVAPSAVAVRRRSVRQLSSPAGIRQGRQTSPPEVVAWLTPR